MFDELRKIIVFVARDFRMLYTYKLAFSVSFFEIIFNIFYLALFGSMFVSASMLYLPQAYGGDFIYYILVGSVGWGFMWSIMYVTSSSLSSEMMMGTLESILLSSTRLTTVLVSYAIFGCFFGLITIIALALVGFFLFGITVFANATIYTLIIFVLSMIMMTGFGMMFGGLTIWLKKIGDTVPLFQNIVMFFCGVYFPIAVLPEFLQPVAYLMPFYYSIEGLRRSLIPTTATSEIVFYVILLVFWSILSVVIGILVLYKGLNKAKKDGTLAFY